MEDFSQLCRALQSEHRTRSIPLSLRDYVRMCLESLADLISEERPEQFHSAMARFFAALYEGNKLFNCLPVTSRNSVDSVTIGVPPRRLFELLNDFARVINELSLSEISSKTVRASLQENGFPYRPNEVFSLLEQAENLDVTDAPKPGPEFSKRKDAKAAYFKVWNYVSKPGNSAKSDVQIAGSTGVDKTMVGRILKETRSPTAEELEPKRTAGKKR
jgi:hypothetical protein